MDWLKNYHEDHMSVLLLISKLDGNIMDLEAGESRPHLKFELDEFGEVLKNVIIPHFKNEEVAIYPKAAAIDKNFTDKMYAEHNLLYSLIDEYLKALKPFNKEQLIKTAHSITEILREHIEKEESILPNLLEKTGV